MVPAPVGMQCVECVRRSRPRVAAPSLVGLARSSSVTSLLITVNVIVWLAGVLLAGGAGLISGSPLATYGGLAAAPVAAGEWWRAITAGFLHSGVLHVGLNMAVLYMLGPPVEAALGRLRFTILYFTALITASFGALLLSPSQLTVGASGAIFGLMGAVLVGQRAAGIDPRRSGILTWIVLNLVFTLVIPGVSIGGHLGGLAGGLIAGWLLFRRSLHPAYATAGCVALTAVCFVALLQVAAHPLRG